MASPTVKLTFEGDTSGLESAANRAGDATERVADNAGSASERIRDSADSAGDGFSRLGDKTDDAEGKFQGLADTITGTGDVIQGFKDGDITAMASGLADLAGGLTEFLIPAIASLATFMKGPLLAAFSFVAAHPLIFALLAIGAALIALWFYSEDFRKKVIEVAQSVWSWVTTKVGGAWTWVKNKAIDFWNWISALPSRIGNAMASVARFISAPYRAAFNFIADAWNNTIGRLSWTVPSWVPFIGGRSISVPRLPKFHQGGIVPGAPGAEMLAVLQAGERVIPADRSMSSAGVGASVTFRGNTSDALATVIMQLIRTGQIQIAA